MMDLQQCDGSTMTDGRGSSMLLIRGHPGSALVDGQLQSEGSGSPEVAMVELEFGGASGYGKDVLGRGYLPEESGRMTPSPTSYTGPGRLSRQEQLRNIWALGSTVTEGGYEEHR